MPTYSLLTRRALLAAALPLAAAEFWNTKRYPSWTEAEVARLLTDSPWARPVVLRGGGTVTVRWTSALPVQMALARQQQGSLSLPQAPREFPAYVITVDGLPAALAPGQQTESRELVQSATSLRRPKRAALWPERIVPHVDGPRCSVEFHFPKDDEITLRDGRADFSTKVGTAGVRCRFSLPEMLLSGALAI